MSFGEQWKRGIYFRDTGEQGLTFERKGEAKTIVYLCSPLPARGTREQLFMVNSDGSDESAHLSLA